MAGQRGIVALAVAAALAGGAFAACTSEDDPAPPGATGPSATASSGLTTAWQVDLTDKAFVPQPPNSGAPAIALGDDVLVLTRRGLVALDTDDGAVLWTTRLPADLCAGPPAADASGVVAVLTGTGDDCSRVVAVDAATGEIAWDRPVPHAADALGQTVAVGPEVVTVTGGCTGYTRFRAADGSLAPPQRVDRRAGCTTAAADGTQVVTSDRGRLSVLSAATGRVTRRVPAPGVEQVGQVLTTHPLVVTAGRADGRTLVDLSGPRPAYLGADEGGYAGEVQRSARGGDLLWVQYDARTVAGFDLASGEAVAELPLDVPGELVGASADTVWVATGQDGHPELERYAAADPRLPDTVGELPSAPDEAGPVRTTTLLGGLVVTVRDRRVDAVRFR